MGSTLAAPQTAFHALGVSGSAQAISADVATGSKSVTLAAATTLVRGDYVMLSSDQTFHVTAALKRGEIKRVETVSDTMVTFEDATYDSYAAASGANLQKILPVTGITLADLAIEGTETDNKERGFYVSYGDDITVTGCTFNYTDWNSINLRHVTNFKVTGCTFRNVDWVSNNPNYYGLVVENATAHGVFSGNHGVKCRHLFTTGYTTAEPGVTRFVVVSGNTDTYSQSASFDTHDGSEHITITGNTSSFSEAVGINCESRETIITDNQINGFTTFGIYARAGSDVVSIRGNRIVAGQGNTTGIYVHNTYAAHRPNRVTVSDNHVDAAVTGIHVTGVDRCSVSGNTVGAIESTRYAMQARNCTKVRFVGNATTSGLAAIYLSDANGTVVANNDAGTCSYGVRMAETAAGLTTNTVVIGNDLTGTTSTKVLNPLGTYKIVGNLGVADSAA
jgi:hypothetical protein